MPKMKDLGINVIPETMRPPECLPYSACACTHITCFGCTRFITCFGCTHIITECVTNTTITICYTGSYPATLTLTPTTPQFFTPQVQTGGLTHESIAQLREQLHQQIAQLDELEKSIPKSEETKKKK